MTKKEAVAGWFSIYTWVFLLAGAQIDMCPVTQTTMHIIAVSQSDDVTIVGAVCCARETTIA